MAYSHVYHTIVMKSSTYFEISNAITTIGVPPTNLTAIQTGMSISIFWTAPPGPPSGGYNVTVRTVNGTGILASYNVPTGSSSYTITIGQPGVYSVYLTGLSQHFPSERVWPVNVNIRGSF